MSLNDGHKVFILFCMFASMTYGLLSCSEDEEFTSASDAYIYFSRDTISFDTVFTDVGSATKEFTIYNPNKKGVRLSSVRLGSNGSSGFRINLDGQYNTQFSDVEVYHEDSLFCFVEVTVDPHDSDSPVMITDSLLFTLENGVVQKVILEAYGQDVIVMKDLIISNDTTFSPSRPIVVHDSLVVADSATLTINAGTVLCFHKYAGLHVHGSVKIEGTMENPVILRGDRTDKLFTYLPYDRLDAQWEGIVLFPESHDNVFNYCNIHGGNYGIVANGNTAAADKYTIRNSIIHNVAGDGLFLQNCVANISNTQISNAGGNCVTVIGGSTHFVHCTIAQFYPWNASHGSALYFANVYDETAYPLEIIEFDNCIITGNSSDEVYGSRMKDSDAAFNYLFYNSLVNTVITDDDEPYFINCVFDQEKNEHRQSSSDTQSNEDETIRGANFRIIDTDVYYYDFRLDSLSAARGLGDGKLTPADCRYDLNGIQRPESNPDAGCYQYEK